MPRVWITKISEYVVEISEAEDETDAIVQALDYFQRLPLVNREELLEREHLEETVEWN